MFVRIGVIVGTGVKRSVAVGTGVKVIPGVPVTPGVEVGAFVSVGPGVNPIGGDVGTGPPAVGDAAGKTRVGVVPGPIGVGVGRPPPVGVGVPFGPVVELLSLQARAIATTRRASVRTLMLPAGNGIDRLCIYSPVGASGIVRLVCP